jgi:hypothetical protein
VNEWDTATAGPDCWPAGMAITLQLLKREPTGTSDTQDPFAAAIELNGCRRRNIDRSMQQLYANVIGLNRARLFEIWPAYDEQPSGIINNGDVLQDYDGSLWIVKATPQSVFDNVSLALCIPE